VNYNSFKILIGKLMAVLGHCFVIIKKNVRSEYFILFLILILAYILRTLPYTLGYTIPFTEDGIRDFQQVKFLIEKHQINFFGSYGNFGSFPVLHLIVYSISRLGFDAMKVFLFVPQIFSVIGLFVFYKFLKNFFKAKQCLWAIFFISVFGPHIYWSAQPVRETIGLFLFPLIIYLYDKFIRGDLGSKSVKIGLAISLLLIVMTHHWSSLMALLWIIFYSTFLVDNWNAVKRGIITTISLFSLAIMAYWTIFFRAPFVFIFDLIRQSPIYFLLFIVGLFLAAILFFFLKKVDLQRFKNKFTMLAVALGILAILSFVSLKMLPIDYPLQIWFIFLLFIVFIYIGFFYYKIKILDKFLLLSFFPLLFWLIALPFFLSNNALGNTLIDPFRTMAFAIFPLSILIAYGYLHIVKKSLFIPIILFFLLIFLATLIYPPIFIYKTKFYGTPFFDLRSDIRYISPQTMELIKLANDNGYNVDSIIPEIRSYQDVFFDKKQKKLYLVLKNSNELRQKYNLIKNSIMKVSDPQKWEDTLQSDAIYSNDAGSLYKAQLDFQFLSQDVPALFRSGEKQVVRLKIKNTGVVDWTFGENIFIAVKNYQKLRVRLHVLNKSFMVKTGEEVDVLVEVEVLSGSGNYSFQFYLRNDSYKIGNDMPLNKIEIVK